MQYESVVKALRANDLAAAQALESQGADLNYVDDIEGAAIHVAVMNSSVDQVNWLLDLGVSLEPLHPFLKVAANELAMSFPAVAHLFLERDLGPKGTEIFYAIKYKDLDQAKSLLAQGCDINYVDPENGTALHQAIYKRSPEFIVWALNNGADPHLANSDGQTPVSIIGNIPELEPIFIDRGIVEKQQPLQALRVFTEELFQPDPESDLLVLNTLLGSKTIKVFIECDGTEPSDNVAYCNRIWSRLEADLAALSADVTGEAGVEGVDQPLSSYFQGDTALTVSGAEYGSFEAILSFSEDLGLELEYDESGSLEGWTLVD